MNVIQKFKINADKCIEILVPDLKDKFNYYYEPTEKLHMFDEVTVVFKAKNNAVTLCQDNLNVILFDFKDSLEKSLGNQILLSNDINIGDLGKYYNTNKINEDSERFDYSHFWLWSKQGMQTWLYNKSNKIYLEISSSYPWLFVEPEQGEDYISFDEFMKNYKPIVVEEIDKNTAQKWLNQCNEVIDSMVKV